METVLRDGHQSLCATRMRIEDMLPACEKLDNMGYWSLECWGGATFDVCMRFLNEDPWERLRALRKAMPNTMTTKATGTRCLRRPRTNMMTKAPPPTARLGRCQCASWRHNSGKRCWRSGACMCRPTSLGACLRMITRARPKVKPRSTGLAMKADTAPTRAAAPTRKSKPVSITSPDANARRSAGSPPAKLPVAANNTAADDEVAEIESLIKARNDARAAKDWPAADAARNRLTEMGIVLEDGAGGTTWRRK